MIHLRFVVSVVAAVKVTWGSFREEQDNDVQLGIKSLFIGKDTDEEEYQMENQIQSVAMATRRRFSSHQRGFNEIESAQKSIPTLIAILSDVIQNGGLHSA